MNRATRRAMARNKRQPAQMLPLANPTAWAATIARSREVEPGVVTTISLKLRTAFEALRNGTGDEEDFVALACALNVGLLRGEQISPLIEQTMLAAQEALHDCARIFEAHGRPGFTGPGLQAIDAALEAYEAITAASTPYQMQQALNDSLHRITHGEFVRIEVER